MPAIKHRWHPGCHPDGPGPEAESAALPAGHVLGLVDVVGVAQIPNHVAESGVRSDIERVLQLFLEVEGVVGVAL